MWNSPPQQVTVFDEMLATIQIVLILSNLAITTLNDVTTMTVLLKQLPKVMRALYFKEIVKTIYAFKI